MIAVAGHPSRSMALPSKPHLVAQQTNAFKAQHYQRGAPCDSNCALRVSSGPTGPAWRAAGASCACLPRKRDDDEGRLCLGLSHHHTQKHSLLQALRSMVATPVHHFAVCASARCYAPFVPSTKPPPAAGSMGRTHGQHFTIANARATRQSLTSCASML